MKKCIVVIFLSFILFNSGFGQVSSVGQKKSNKKIGIGIKAGYNWSYATANQSGVSLNNKNGYMAGIFFAPGSGRSIGFRSEIIYSHQGYSFENGGKNTSVMNDYIYLPQLTKINITRFFQIQFGGQIGLLLNAKKSSSNQDSSVSNFMNKIDFGFAGGIESNPVGGLIIGGRYNLGLGKLYKESSKASTTTVNNVNPFPLPFNPQTTNLKNGVLQIYIGYKF